MLQEATARAWKHFTTDDHDLIAIRPWLFTVVRNLVIDHHRARSIRPPEACATDCINLPVHDAVDRVLTSQTVLEALDRLTTQQRRIIVLTYHRGYSVQQAAEHLHIRPGTVKFRTHYALRALEEGLRACGVLHP
ncbi:sigma-70 family RNA polymerase sigma factor [Streptomyces minutiscleroticus]|uniref:sigma-70 family RNA polymerase sigma factor n=1 Tax=Streptomyces minutiscleroticus TaxID=68238 RepID=UPI0033331487